MNYLDKIICNKRIEVEAAKVSKPLDIIVANIATAPSTRPFAQSILQRNGIIAEFKRQSPSKGIIHDNIEPESVVTLYEQAGVSAVSVLTDTDFFGGQADDLQQASNILNIPALRKDFIIDEYQIYEARALGASAILLIAAVLSKDECARFALLAKQLGLEVLLELHDDDEFDRIADGVTVIGINNRNLRTFKVDLQHSMRLASQLPADMPKISESGIRTIDDMLMLRNGGFDGFLIGENFMREENPGKACITFCDKYNSLCRQK